MPFIIIIIIIIIIFYYKNNVREYIDQCFPVA
jgi:hypothetical protein